ncbi:Hypothetical protein MVR_LOCUS191 [uncultured virus]|nr:Hypothetical protein MVR_LOCUS191 [uncultured virus]
MTHQHQHTVEYQTNSIREIQDIWNRLDRSGVANRLELLEQVRVIHGKMISKHHRLIHHINEREPNANPHHYLEISISYTLLDLANKLVYEIEQDEIRRGNVTGITNPQVTKMDYEIANVTQNTNIKSMMDKIKQLLSGNTGGNVDGWTTAQLPQSSSSSLPPIQSPPFPASQSAPPTTTDFFQRLRDLGNNPTSKNGPSAFDNIQQLISSTAGDLGNKFQSLFTGGGQDANGSIYMIFFDGEFCKYSKEFRPEWDKIVDRVAADHENVIPIVVKMESPTSPTAKLAINAGVVKTPTVMLMTKLIKDNTNNYLLDSIAKETKIMYTGKGININTIERDIKKMNKMRL